jgi:DNA-3-methyladenine glycosylase I
MNRCEWANSNSLIEYHDTEWGVPVHDDRLLFEFLILEGAQAGLSWSTVLNKRNGYRKAFDNFEPDIVARYSDERMARLLLNPNIIRNRLKVKSAVENAKAFVKLRAEFGSFDAFVWQFVNGRTIHNSWRTIADIPSMSAESQLLSTELKKRGFKYVGGVICYAFMQAVGMVNDHTLNCYRYEQLKGGS